MKLTSSDRHLLKALFGFVKTIPSLTEQRREEDDGLKTIESACLYVRQTLFPSKLSDAEKEREEGPFPLKELIPHLVPSLFEHTLDSLKKMFLDGRIMTDLAQTSMIRSFQKFSRLFTPELAVKQNGQIRVWISGSVSRRKRKTYGPTDKY